MSIAGLAGHKLAGLYHLITAIAHGAHSVVYESRHVFTQQRSAVKIFHPQSVTPESLARCRRDAEMAAALHHPGIVRVLEWGRKEVPLSFVVYEFADGEDVRTRVRRLGRLPPQSVLELGLRVCVVLQAAHKLGVLHRGLTPRNLLYTDAGPDALEEGEVVKVLDFGVAHLAPLPGLDEGDLPYRAPELVAGEEVDARADQYALAAVLYEALSGREPPLHEAIALDDEVTAAPSLALLCPEAPSYMVRAIERALAPARHDRYPSISDFMRALDDRAPTPLRVPLRGRSGVSPLPSGRSAGVLDSESSARLRAQITSAASARLRGSQQSAVLDSESGRRPAALPGEAGAPSAHSLTPVVRQERAPSAASARRRSRQGVWTVVAGTAAAGALALYFGRASHPVERAEVTPPPLLQPAAAPPAEPPQGPSEAEQVRLVDEAEQALAQGEAAQAIDTARRALPLNSAWRVIGLAACRLGDTRLLEEALAHLGPGMQQDVRETCRQQQQQQPGKAPR